jgi:hypothetical protein
MLFAAKTKKAVKNYDGSLGRFRNTCIKPFSVSVSKSLTLRAEREESERALLINKEWGKCGIPQAHAQDNPRPAHQIWFRAVAAALLFSLCLKHIQHAREGNKYADCREMRSAPRANISNRFNSLLVGFKKGCFLLPWCSHHIKHLEACFPFAIWSVWQNKRASVENTLCAAGILKHPQRYARCR